MKIVQVIVLATACYAQTAQDILNNTPSLSTLSSLVDKSPQFSVLLATAYNFTFLAPNNDAFSKWLSGNYTQDFVDATLTYHLLAGNYATALFSNGSSFIPTALTNRSYANVTGGQRIEVVKNDDVVFQSGNKTASHLLYGDIIVDSGVIHVIDTVFQIPSDFLETIMNANLSYAVAFFSEGRFLGGFNESIITDIILDSDLTYFIPNSAQAVAALQGSNVSSTQEFMNLVGYYILVGNVVYSVSFRNDTNLTTYSGLPLTVRILDNGAVYIDDAKVIGSDYLISNGVMHIIDNIIFPGNTTGPATNTSIIHHQTLSKAAEAGVGVGGGLILLLAILSVVIRKRQKHKATEEPPYPASHEEFRPWQEAPPSELSSPYEFELNSGKQWMTVQLETQERPVELPVLNI